MVKKLIVICGATASGKSGLALELAQRLNTVILSADSRQVYRQFDIGTAKPSAEEQKLIKHYLIDVCEPTATLTLAEYQKQAQTLIESDLGTDKPLLLVGGTGLYLKSIVQGLKIPRVSPQQELRQQLQALGQAQCYQFLGQVDIKAAQKIHPNDETRTLRALEVFYTTGRPISEQQGENPPSYPILQIGLDCDVQDLEERIKRRTQTMLERGLIREVETIINQYCEDLPLLDTLGYREIKEYLKGDISLDSAQYMIVLHTRQFAKRQRTWFRGNREIQWFDANSVDLVEQVLHAHNFKIS
jgi:tRNA dimethylallyltransferase